MEKSTMEEILYSLMAQIAQEVRQATLCLKRRASSSSTWAKSHLDEAMEAMDDALALSSR